MPGPHGEPLPGEPGWIPYSLGQYMQGAPQYAPAPQSGFFVPGPSRAPAVEGGFGTPGSFSGWLQQLAAGSPQSYPVTPNFMQAPTQTLPKAPSLQGSASAGGLFTPTLPFGSQLAATYGNTQPPATVAAASAGPSAGIYNPLSSAPPPATQAPTLFDPRTAYGSGRPVAAPVPNGPSTYNPLTSANTGATQKGNGTLGAGANAGAGAAASTLGGTAGVANAGKGAAARPKADYNTPLFDSNGVRVDSYKGSDGKQHSNNRYVDFSYYALDSSLGTGFTDQFINRMKVDPIRFYAKAFQDDPRAGGYKLTGEPNDWLVGKAADAADKDAHFLPGALAEWQDKHGTVPPPPEQWDKWWGMSQGGYYTDQAGRPYGVA